jgi:endonuclease YncB( thermonuclease family)
VVELTVSTSVLAVSAAAKSKFSQLADKPMKSALRVNTRSAFFFVSIFSFSLFTSNTSLADSCRASDLGRGRGESVAIKTVYDGDTLTLRDGRKIRLIGVNTPERGRKGKPDEVLALAAKQAVQSAVESAVQAGNSRQQGVRLYLGREQSDAYGRTLGHIFVDGQSLSATLLSKGLGWHVVVPPNTGLASCFAAAEQRARRQGKGLWRSTLAQSIATKNIVQGGYQRVRGIVRKVSFAKAWWINFDDGFVAVIYPENQPYFDKSMVSGWRGKQLEIEGWVYGAKYRGKPQWRIKLTTPYSMSVL